MTRAKYSTIFRPKTFNDDDNNNWKCLKSNTMMVMIAEPITCSENLKKKVLIIVTV
jgi:hypothetical protein